MSFAFILPDACRAAEAALAQLTANLVAKRGTCKLTPDDIDYLRGRINAVRVRLASDAYLRELWPAPHVAIGVKNNIPLQYSVHVLGQIVESLDSLGKDCPPKHPAQRRLAGFAEELGKVRGILEDALALHLRRERVPLNVPEVISEPGQIKTAEVVSRYLEFLTKRVERNEYGANTFEITRLELCRFAQAYGDRPVSELRQHDLTAWLEANPQWLAVHTRRRVANTLIAMFNYATEEDYVVKNPFRSPRAIRGIPPNVRRPAEQREYVALMWCGSRELRLALFFLRRSGARTAEMRSITWDDLRLDDAAPHVFLKIHKTFRQTHKPRIIPLDKTLVRVLKAVKRRAAKRQRLTGTEHVFTNTDGTPWDRHSFARHLRRTATKFGLDHGIVSRISAYMLRHSFAVEALEAGVGIRQVADVLGHAKLDTISQFYGSHTRHHKKHLSDVANTIDEARNEKRRSNRQSKDKPNGKDGAA